MIEKRSPKRRKSESVAKLVSRAKKLLWQASTLLNREPEPMSATQLVKFIDDIYKTQKILTQLEDDSDNLLRKLLRTDAHKR
jgi:hypothetical protein